MIGVFHIRFMENNLTVVKRKKGPWTNKKRPPFSKKWKENMSKAQIGKKLSEETKIKMRKPKSIETIIKFRKRRQSKETRLKISKSRTGMKFSEEHIKNLSGENSHLWKGGVSSMNDRIRKSFRFKRWREYVFKRDNWTCQKTGVKGGKLHPHHIFNFSSCPELRFNLENGITLSETSHNEFHKIYGKRNNTLEQINEYLNRNQRLFQG